MDIRIKSEDAARLGIEACASIFGEDISLGPLHPMPDKLRQIRDAWPIHPDDVLAIALELPPDNFDPGKARARDDVMGVKIVMHRAAVIANGRLVGYTLRMDAASLSGVKAWEDAWAAYRRRVRQGVG